MLDRDIEISKYLKVEHSFSRCQKLRFGSELCALASSRTKGAILWQTLILILIDLPGCLQNEYEIMLSTICRWLSTFKCIKRFPFHFFSATTLSTRPAVAEQAFRLRHLVFRCLLLRRALSIVGMSLLPRRSLSDFPKLSPGWLLTSSKFGVEKSKSQTSTSFRSSPYRWSSRFCRSGEPPATRLMQGVHQEKNGTS